MKTFYLIVTFTFLSFGYSSENEEKKLDKSQALNLAVKISNEECNEKFGVEPFDTNSYEMKYKNGYWIWGTFDPSGIDGYSVSVKFDKYGKNDTVEVYFSIDEEILLPTDEPNPRR